VVILVNQVKSKKAGKCFLKYASKTKLGKTNTEHVESDLKISKFFELCIELDCADASSLVVR